MKKIIQLLGLLSVAWLSIQFVDTQVSAQMLLYKDGEEVVVDTPTVVTSTASASTASTETAAAKTTEVTYEPNYYEVGQCTWGAKELAPWAGTYWGNGGEWADSARAAGFEVGTTPKVGAIAVWTSEYGGYGHVAVVTDVQSETSIQVMEANYSGDQTIGNHRGWFDPTTTSEGTVSYIYPKA